MPELEQKPSPPASNPFLRMSNKAIEALVRADPRSRKAVEDAREKAAQFKAALEVRQNAVDVAQQKLATTETRMLELALVDKLTGAQKVKLGKLLNDRAALRSHLPDLIAMREHAASEAAKKQRYVHYLLEHLP